MKEKYIGVSRRQFLSAMNRGWKDLAYVKGFFFGDRRKKDMEDRADIKLSSVVRGEQKPYCACAIGAAAYALGVDPYYLAAEIMDEIQIDVIYLSDRAGDKRKAKKRVAEAVQRHWEFGKFLRVKVIR